MRYTKAQKKAYKALKLRSNIRALIRSGECARIELDKLDIHLCTFTAPAASSKVLTARG
jgi:hypothetical protein